MDTIKVVAFDCDGVLFDTEQANRAYYNHILTYFKRPVMTAEQFDYVHTHTLGEALAFLFDDEGSLEAAHAYRQTMDYRSFLPYMEMEPHLVRLLEKLRPRCKTAIATNRSDSMNRLLADFNLSAFFDLVVTSADIERPKPHPDALLKILTYFKIEPGQAIFIGDSELDEMAARSAGVPFVAYRNPTLSSPYHIQSLREVENILTQGSEG
ncbi:MAG: HAD family hydrolase [Desulfobacterales bacterium]|nr:MAG: HAD family hydrolase [Desulfobacterales bacterium]